MNQTLPLTKSDLEPFADIGSSVDGPLENASGTSWMLVRDAEQLTVHSAPDGKTTVISMRTSVKFASPAAMLASPIFGDLTRWADNQEKLLKQGLSFDLISIEGKLFTGTGGGDSHSSEIDKEAFDIWLRKPQSERSRVVVIDGPAGVGKTTVMRYLAIRRAEVFRETMSPLILHIESRGKTLQSITDLMAAALQNLRARTTYDEAIPLIRHGLVTLAIDGFDELVDPSGYDTAWGQLNELVTRTLGRATIILAGRETMVSLGRIQEALNALRLGPDGTDTLSRFTLMDPSPAKARLWLKKSHGWTDRTFDADLVQPIFEAGSYALRPFFLAQVGPLRDQIEEGAMADEDLLIFLVRNMLKREASKFGENLEIAVGIELLTEFVRVFLQEVSRELAESQSTVISADNLRLCAEAAATVVEEGKVAPDVIPTLVNRAEVIAFLTTDIRPGYRRFSHEQLSIHFLSEDCMRSVGNGEVPKYIRRNIWGLESLEGFSKVARASGHRSAALFIEQSTKTFASAGHGDRTRQNLAALSVIVLSVSVLPDEIDPSVWKGVGLSELLIPAGEAPPIAFETVTVNVLHAAGADLRAITWSNASVIILRVDDQTVPSTTIKPAVVEHVDGRTLRGNDALSWVTETLGTTAAPAYDTDGVSRDIRKLLRHIERYRSFWLRDDEDTDDRASRKIVSDPNWPFVREVLREKRKFREEFIPSSGSKASFIHFVAGIQNISKDLDVMSALKRR